LLGYPRPSCQVVPGEILRYWARYIVTFPRNVTNFQGGEPLEKVWWCEPITQLGSNYAGYKFIGRYHRMPQSRMTPRRTSESAALSGAGLSIVSIWEYRSGANDHGGIVTLSYQTGRDEGLRAYAQAIAIPQSAGAPIYFCVDEGYDPARAAGPSLPCSSISRRG
jgi:hypothetical protein